MCHSLTFLSHLDNIPFFFLFVFFDEFQQKSYVGMWGHFGSRVMGIYLGPISKTLSLTINFLWWYTPFIYGGLCPICFSKRLGFGGFVFVYIV
jgi:hypothetical protein